MLKTLEELKHENAELEEAAKQAEVEVEEDEGEGEGFQEADEPESEVETEEAEAESEADDEESDESWLNDDEQSVEKKQTVPVSVLANVRGKLKGKNKELEAEIEELKQKLSERPSAPQVQASQNKPKLIDFADHNDPEEAYLDALNEWKEAERVQLMNQQATQEAVQQQLTQIESSVTEHYGRAAELTKKHGISEENYRAADVNVRKAFEAAFPDNGDIMADAVISQIGEGSEKVMYYLGRNTAQREKLQALLISDQTGIKASLFLGELKAKVSMPTKRKSAAPQPTPEVTGDVSTGGDSKALKRKYDKAHKSGNAQAAFDIKRQAKSAGHNTNDW